MTATKIVAYINSTPILKQAAHAKKLEENPEWTLVLGIGYNESQKNNGIYLHLKKMLAELQNVTGGDVTKAKQLTDLLYTRVHAGEANRLNATPRKRRPTITPSTPALSPRSPSLSKLCTPLVATAATPIRSDRRSKSSRRR